jgi:pimeloyl-[acyl-carrier protein] methyl ester esterase
MTQPLSTCFIGGWGSTEEVWRGALAQYQSLAPVPLPEPLFLRWLDCLQDWPGVLKAISAMPGSSLLVGWSLGSLLSLRAALELPGKIAAMVLVSATPCMCAGPDRGGIDPRILAAMRVRFARNPGPVLNEFACQCARPDGDDRTRDGYLLQAGRFSPAELALGLQALAELDVRERLGEFKMPCTLLHGEGDRIVPLPNARLLATQISGAELRILEGRGHALPFTAPAQIAQCISSLLS